MLRKNDKGITLVSLAITIVVMSIMATIIVYSISDSGDAIEALNTVDETYNDEKNKVESEIGNINSEWGDVISKRGTDSEVIAKTRLTASEISAINTHTALQTINYTPDTVGTTVTIPADYNGGVEDQNFTQTSLGAQSLSWYVLSADENGVNIVSSPTSSKVAFCDAGGYDNCLYYLNELSTKLFTKPSLGVTADRVHAFKLTDIKYAVEQMNGSQYNWNETFVKGAPFKNSGTRAYNGGNVGEEVTTPQNKAYPQIYGNKTGTVELNNNLYDEFVSYTTNRPIKDDFINSTSSKASELRVKFTFIGYWQARDTMIGNLGQFATSGMGQELFKVGGPDYWLSSRCVYEEADRADYHIRGVSSGVISGTAIAGSQGYARTGSDSGFTFRVIASIPASMINVSADGTVTLK